MKTHRIIRVGFEEVYLLLELEGVGPVVIALAQGNVFTSNPGENEGLGHAAHTLGILILLVEDRENLIGVFFSVFADDFRGAIGRAIIIDEDFDGKIALLHQKPIQTLSDKRCVVIRDARYTN